MPSMPAATCCGCARAKAARTAKPYCQPSCWSCCVCIGEPSGPETGSFQGPTELDPSVRRLSTTFAVLREKRRASRSEEHTSELQSLRHLVCRLLLEKKNTRR